MLHTVLQSVLQSVAGCCRDTAMLPLASTRRLKSCVESCLVALRGRLCHALGCKHTTQNPALTKRPSRLFAAWRSILFFFMAWCHLVLPIVYQAAIKNFKTNHTILSHRAGSCASLSNSVALPQELHAKKHMHTLRPAVSRYTAQDCPCLQFHGPGKGA